MNIDLIVNKLNGYFLILISTKYGYNIIQF